MEDLTGLRVRFEGDGRKVSRLFLLIWLAANPEISFTSICGFAPQK